jgi:large-conductance mechanosensitive channel
MCSNDKDGVRMIKRAEQLEKRVLNEGNIDIDYDMPISSIIGILIASLFIAAVIAFMVYIIVMICKEAKDENKNEGNEDNKGNEDKEFYQGEKDPEENNKE